MAMVAGGVAAAATAASAVNSIANGGGGTPAQNSSSSAPWAVQQPFLQQGFQSAQDLYNQNKNSPAFQGPLYAGLNPTQQAAIKQMITYGQMGSPNVGSAYGAAGSLLNSASPFAMNAAHFANGNFGPTRAPSASLQGSLEGAATGALASGQGFGANANGILSRAQGDPTQANINSAGQYASNPYMDGMVDAASRDITRNLNENVLPGIDQAATATGNINSSRAGAQAAIAQRGAADRIGDISANLRGSAYSNGLSLAEQARQANLSGSIAANGQIGTNFGQGVNASTAALGSGLAGQSLDINSRLAGNSQLGTGAQMGFQGAGAANSIAAGASQLPLTAGGLLQQDQQGQDTAALQQFNMNDQRPYDLLQRYWSIVNGGNFGSQSSSTATPAGPSGFQNAMGNLTGLAGLAQQSNFFGLGGGGASQLPNSSSDPGALTVAQLLGR